MIDITIKQVENGYIVSAVGCRPFVYHTMEEVCKFLMRFMETGNANS